ncbi:MAG: 2Fe-2S iron-sulfur cluster-binding protein [Thermoleophilia bacterium]
MDSGSVKVFVDGRQVRVPVGSSILDACDHAGTYVPRLCAYPGLEPLGDCGLCFVKVDGGAARRACSVTVAPGMRVDTRDEEALGFRAGSMRAILGDHPHVCLTCPDRDGCSRDECTYGEPPEARCCGEFGRCEIARVASFVGALESAPAFTLRSLGEPTVDHTIRRDLELCIGCGRCVAACDTLDEAGSALKLVETRSRRGGGTGIDGGPGIVADWEPRSYLGRNVAVPKEADLRLSGCTFCGACVMVCPTGALTAHGRRGAAWLAKRRERSTLRTPVLPPEMRRAYNADALAVVPAREGVFRLYSVAGECLQISGVMDLFRGLKDAARGPFGSEIHSFDFEVQAMYTQRESEFLARHLQEHGSMPRGNDALGGAFDDDEDDLL